MIDIFELMKTKQRYEIDDMLRKLDINELESEWEKIYYLRKDVLQAFDIFSMEMARRQLHHLQNESGKERV